jgi:hypothetical protein
MLAKISYFAIKFVQTNKEKLMSKEDNGDKLERNRKRKLENLVKKKQRQTRFFRSLITI